MRAPHPPRLTVIAAVARNGVIGHAGSIPWRLPGDLAQFRATTVGHPVLMGRRTYESIGHPLPQRRTVVLSNRPGFGPAGVWVAPTFAAGLALSAEHAAALAVDTVMIAGGAAVYGAALPLADTLFITEVDLAPPGDTLFPPIDPVLWDRIDLRQVDPGPGDICAYRFVRYGRRRPASADNGKTVPDPHHNVCP